MAANPQKLTVALLEAAERKSKSGTGRRALDGVLRQHATEEGLLDLGALSRVVDALVPGTGPRDVLSLFAAHSQPTRADSGMAIPIRSLANSIMCGEVPVPPSRPDNAAAASAAMAVADRRATDARFRPRAPPPPRHAWDEWSAPAPDRQRSTPPPPAAPLPAPHKPAPPRPQVPARTVSDAIRQLQQVLELRASSSAAGALPAAERHTLHLSARVAAARQIALLRVLRAVAPHAMHLNPAELSAALDSLAPDFSSQRGHAGARVVFAEPDVQQALWDASRDVSGPGSVDALLALICPLPAPAERPPAPPHRFDGEHSGFRAPEHPCASSDAYPSSAGELATSERPAYGPPFDRETGRKGRRHVAAPAHACIPRTIRYRFCQSGVAVPHGFDPRDVTRSALPPAVSLRREFVYGYNGLGRHNRAPNVFALSGGRVLYCAAALAIVYDPATAAQSCFEGHDDDITCVALHPGGKLAVTGQCASAFSGTAPWLAVWDVETKADVSRVGWVPDETPASTQGRAHAPGATPSSELPPTALPASHATVVPPPAAYKSFYQRSVCAVSFSPDGSLLIGVGTDDQHTIGVWNWRRRELLVAAPCLAARSPGVHHLAIAPLAPPGGTLLLVTVGLSAQPKFWSLTPPQKQKTGTQRRLADAAAAGAPGAAATNDWALTAQIGRIGGKDGELPKSLSCVAFGGAAFASPSGAPHGLTFIGGGGGRIFIFDAPRSPAAIYVIKSAHPGAAVTALAAADGGIISGGADGRILFWAPAPPGKDAQGKERAPFMVQKPAHTYVIGHGAASVAPTDPAAGVALALRGGRAPPKPGKDATAVTAAAALGSSLVGGAGVIRSLAVMPRGAGSTEAAAQGEAAADDRRGVRFAHLMREAATGPPPTDALRRPASASAASAPPLADSRLAGVMLPRLLVGTARCSLWVCAPPRTGKDASASGSSQELAAGHFGDATAVEPHPLVAGVWASAGADRQLLLWQRGPRRTPIQRASLPAGASCLAFSPDGSLLAAGLFSGAITLLRPASLDYPTPAAGAGGKAVVATPQHDRARGQLCDIKFAPGSGAHGGHLACGGHDRVVDVYELVPAALGLSLRQVACCRGHTGTVQHLDWSADGSMLMSNCAAKEILFWAMPSGKRIVSHAPSVAAAKWATWTCALGFPAIGIWPDGSDGSDVNAVHRSADGRLILTADDFGTLKLFHCPCVVEDAPYRRATGHCSHLSCARFLLGDELAVSSGGSDRSLMLWALAPELEAGRDHFRQQPAKEIQRAAWRSNGHGQAANPLW